MLLAGGSPSAAQKLRLTDVNLARLLCLDFVEDESYKILVKFKLISPKNTKNYRKNVILLLLFTFLRHVTDKWISGGIKATKKI